MEMNVSAQACIMALLLCQFWSCAVVAGNWHSDRKHQHFDQFTSSAIVFPVIGNVFPQGLYSVAVEIGIPPKTYFLDIDTGSDLTWLHCDAPYLSASPIFPLPRYKPKKQQIVRCKENDCLALQHRRPCRDPREQCDYEVEYADRGSAHGVLVRDAISLRLANGSGYSPDVVFGCGSEKKSECSGPICATDGVLGLGRGQSGVLWQMSSRGIVRNVLGHCFSSSGGGFLFFGDGMVPAGVTWTPVSRSGRSLHYTPGSAHLHLGNHTTGVKDLRVVFDSGSSYTYLTARAYQAVISSVSDDLSGKFREAKDDQTLPLCWKGHRRITRVKEISKYFRTLVFRFGKKAALEIPPEGYLIISLKGNVCMGILNGSEIGLDNLNIIGDVSMQNLLVIYDNENQQIGWVAADCSRLSDSRSARS